MALVARTPYPKRAWEDWFRLLLEILSRVLPWLLYLKTTKQSVPSSIRKVVALPLIGGVLIWDLAGLLYWVEQVIHAYNAIGLFTIAGLATIGIVSLEVLLVMGIVSAGAEWVLKRVVPEWFGTRENHSVGDRPSYIIMKDIGQVPNPDRPEIRAYSGRFHQTSQA